MDWQKITKRFGNGNWIKVVLPAVIALILIKAFSPQTQAPDKPFSMKTCLESIPEDVKGLKITQGSRSKAIIINDMVPVVCKAKATFKRMRAEGAPIEPGSMTFRVVVEYNGEVISARIQESDITYRAFRNSVIDLISEKDFMTTLREDTDTIFFYPIHFGQRQ